jgi:transposase InsO family protein
VVRDDEDALTQAIVELASEYGRYGYRRTTALLRQQGWHVNHKRVERIWRREGLKVPQKQPKRGRLWLNDGSCVRRRPQHRHHVWSYDFVMDRTHDGRAFRMLTVIDEYSRECLAIRTERRQNQETVLETLADLFLLYGPPDYIRSDNGAEFTATAVREWLRRLHVQTLFIEPGSPWENGYNESFNLLHAERSQSARRAMAHPLQHNPTTQLAGLPPAGTAGNQLTCHACIGYATMSTHSHFTGGVVTGGWSVLGGQVMSIKVSVLGF